MSDPSTWPSAKFKTDHWPRLSESLPFTEPGECANCGAPESEDFLSGKHPYKPALYVWREHDQFDNPEGRFVTLCVKCSDRLIEPHPRLYARLETHTPAPGVMEVCRDCKHRDGNRCLNPASLANGGEGIALVGPKPTTVYIDGVDKRGRRFGRWLQAYDGPVKSCSGKEG